MKVIKLSPKYKERLLEIQKLTYQEEFQETPETMDMLLSDNTYNFGLLDDNDVLIGCQLCDHTTLDKKELWLWDISIIPAEQHKGYAKLLLNHFFDSLRGKGLKLLMLCRETSHNMFTNEKNLVAWGYKVAKDVTEKDGYWELCKVHEDLYEVELVPADTVKNTKGV